MSEELQVDPVITKLIKLVEEKDIAILELKSRIDGVGTRIQFLLEGMNSSIVESRIASVNNNFDSYELKIDKICHRLNILENNLNQYFCNFQNK